MAKLNKELQTNLKEINDIIFKMTEVDNDVVLTTSIHSEMIVVSINLLKMVLLSWENLITYLNATMLKKELKQ